MNSYLRRLLLFVIITTYSTSYIQSKEAPFTYLTQPSKVKSLESKHGFVLFDLDVAGTAPSFFIRRYSVNKPFFEPDTRMSFDTIPLRVRFDNNASGVFTVPLKEGLYQITQVDAPFYDLPYKIDMDTSRTWRFYVERDKINYAGKLVIEQDRGQRTIDVNFYNRFATDIDAIQAAVSDFPFPLPLIMNPGVQDDFQTYLAQ